ncbi:nucleotidyltransferase [Aggregatibacter actinomycetemcomitans]|uniref:SMODS domain-containing nucleotidyltransferase n=1 Tax=Aggregatibacter actinomycetemcomitans TaxID=714 RepID=UPI00197B39D3|nr:nucleotidyltransferase [Aggregatibacter actinomycetemcomitans]MBN6067726.1 nucleotidyltransferase [Aggregatibacter actinomycetemcomitans]MBN6085663.1 nucleotidyltransferase [Aggregatibacter actinomycetemcomitans]
MTVSSYLNELANQLIIRDSEKDSIRRSFSTLESRLNNYFNGDIEFVRKFGSYHRETILPRNYDINSDVDVLVKFTDKSYKPQTYLNKLKQFAEYWYSRSEIYQSSPTIVLELNHIKFELVPCLDAEWYESGNYKIPSKASDYQEWLLTSPFEFNDELTRRNKTFNYKIKLLIRVLKRWNVNTRYSKIYDSFKLEEKIVNHGFSYLNSSLKDYFFDFVTNMNGFDLPSYKREEVEKLINKVKEIQRNEDNYPIWAENELRKIFD